MRSFITPLNRPSRPPLARLAIAVSISGVLASAPAEAGASCFGRSATITGTAGSDSLEGTPGDDVISGLGGDDSIYPGGGDDRICGDMGNDVLGGGSGADRISGGAGIDFFIIIATQDAKVDLGAGSVSGGEGSDTIRRHSIEGVRVADCRGSNHHVIVGDGRVNYLYGQESKETIRGGGGDDAIWGDGAHPTSDICPGVNDDRLFGGAGDDGIDAAGGNDYIHGGSGRDGAAAGGGRDVCVSVEQSYDCERRR